MAAVAASQTAMAAVANSPAAVAAIWNSPTAIQKVQANSIAWTTFTGASTAVMGKAVAILAGLNPDSYANMAAIAASSTAMAAVAASTTAVSAMAASATAKAALLASSLVKVYSWSSSKWTANPLTAVSGKGLLLKIQITNNAGSWSLPGTNNHKVLLDGSAFTATNGHSTANIYQQSTNAVIDESVRRYNSSIQVYLYNATQITYIPC